MGSTELGVDHAALRLARRSMGSDQGLLPGRARHVGVTARDNRLFVEAVLLRYRAGIPWRDLPESKIPALVDALGNPVGFCVTGGQEHDLAGPTNCCRRCKPIRSSPIELTTPTRAFSNPQGCLVLPNSGHFENEGDVKGGAPTGVLDVFAS